MVVMDSTKQSNRLYEEQQPADELGEPIDVEEYLVQLLMLFQATFHKRVSQDHLDSLCFNLQRLFISMDTLYLVLLPDLAIHTQQNSGDLLSRRYQIWTYLLEIKSLIEQLEPCGQLINTQISRILDQLDQSSQALDVQEARAIPQEQWEQSLTIVTERLNDWQQCHNRCPSCDVQFSEFQVLISSISQMDTALDLLLDYTCAIFGDILADFRLVRSNDTEGVALLLLDLMQKIDLLLWQIDELFDPLYPLLKQHAIGAHMH
jgi:hypothetical protein